MLHIQSQSIFEKANIYLQKWKSNSNKFMTLNKKYEKRKRLEVLEKLLYQIHRGIGA